MLSHSTATSRAIAIGAAAVAAAPTGTLAHPGHEGGHELEVIASSLLVGAGVVVAVFLAAILVARLLARVVKKRRV